MDYFEIFRVNHKRSNACIFFSSLKSKRYRSDQFLICSDVGGLWVVQFMDVDDFFELGIDLAEALFLFHKVVPGAQVG